MESKLRKYFKIIENIFGNYINKGIPCKNIKMRGLFILHYLKNILENKARHN